MSYNMSALWEEGGEHWFCKKMIVKALENSMNVDSAFIWWETKQGDYFWENYRRGGNQEEGKAVLRAFLNLDEIKLEDLI